MTAEMKAKVIDRMNQILFEVGGDYKSALFVACGLVEIAKPKAKPKRGRPVELVYPDNINKRGLGISKTLKRKLAKSSKIGAPQKYDLKGMPTKTLAKKIAYKKLSGNYKSFAAAARAVSKEMGLPSDISRIKQLADLAARSE